MALRICQNAKETKEKKNSFNAFIEWGDRTVNK